MWNDPPVSSVEAVRPRLWVGRRRFVWTAILLLGGLLPVHAEPPVHFAYRAELAQPLPRAQRLFAAGVRWSCNGALCTASVPQPRPKLETCRALVRRVGAVVRFGQPALQFDDEQIARCNAALQPAAR